jgi:hypothetical protein
MTAPRPLPPERLAGQGLDPHQEESGNRAILALLADPEVGAQTDLVVTWRAGAYEVWAARGMIRFRRVLAADGTVGYEVIEQIGANPVANQDPAAIATIAEELGAAAASGHPTEDPDRAFIEPEALSYPFAYERIAQLFDSPDTGDLVVSPRCYAFGLQPGTHGALDVVQSRAILAVAGPGVRPGRTAVAARAVDIAPTICRLMRFPLIDGADATGRRASERGRPPDVYLRRQDGRVLDEIVAPGGPVPERVYMIILDGLSHSELCHQLETGSPAVGNLRRILDRAAFFTAGVTVNFPSITWPSHTTILTGAWCGHHDIVNPSYYLRTERDAVSPQGQGMDTERFLGDGVETLYEAFHRVLGESRTADGRFAPRGAFTAAVYEPQGRGADHAPLERRIVGDRARVKALTAQYLAEVNPRWQADGKETVHAEAALDARGLAQIEILFDDPAHPVPVFVAHELTVTDAAGHDYGPHHEGLRMALADTDRLLGRVLDLLEAKGLLDSTLFVVTSDHGMAAQQTELHANPARHPERTGIKTLTAEPMIWLRDLEVEVHRAADGRTARVTVRDNDPDRSGEKPPVEGVEILVHGPADRLIAHERTDTEGLAGFATPADVPPGEIGLSVRHRDFNPRHLRLDGTNLTLDLRRALYGDGRGRSRG